MTAQEYTDAMTLSGTKVEGYEELDADLEKIVIGQIVKIENTRMRINWLSARLMWVRTEPVQIVTGAPNVFEGAIVPVVLVGGRVAGGHDRDTNAWEELKSKRASCEGWKASV